MHLSDLQLREILQRTEYPAEDTPRDALEAHMETCGDCQSRLSEMKEFHEDMEFPRLESIDPEGMKIRRMRAALELRQMEAQR